MKNKFRNLKYIERYFSGNMSKLEKEQFEEELCNNKALADELFEYTLINATIGDSNLLDFHKTIRKTFKQWQLKNKGFLERNLSNKYLMAAAATIVITVAAGITAIIVDLTRSHENIEIYAQDTTSIKKSDTINNIIIFDKQDHTALEATEKDNSIFEDQTAIETEIDYSTDIYKISPLYTELLGTSMRSGQFQLLSPIDSAIIKQGEKITIEFKGSYPVINLDILSHKGQIKKSLKNISSGHQFQNNLPPGAYLLRFQTGEDPVWWGVVFVWGGSEE